MLEDVEMRFILTNGEGKVIGCYNKLESAELDAKDLAEAKGAEFKLQIYELLSAQRIGEPYLQNLYELRKSFPESAAQEKK